MYKSTEMGVSPCNKPPPLKLSGFKKANYTNTNLDFMSDAENVNPLNEVMALNINTPLVVLGSPDELESPSPGLRELKPKLLASPKHLSSKAYKINVTATKKAAKLARKASRSPTNSIQASVFAKMSKLNSSNMSSVKSIKRVNLDIEIPTMVA
jgi:hypothetical protein